MGGGLGGTLGYLKILKSSARDVTRSKFVSKDS